jgi:hypothetical protein
MPPHSTRRLALPKPPPAYDADDQAHARASIEKASELWQPKTVYLGTRARQIEDEIADGRINLRNFAHGDATPGDGARMADAFAKMRSDGIPVFAPEGVWLCDETIDGVHAFGSTADDQLFAVHGVQAEGKTVFKFNQFNGTGRCENFASADVRDITFDAADDETNAAIQFVGTNAGFSACRNLHLLRVRVMNSAKTAITINGGVYVGRVADCYAYGARHGYTLEFSGKTVGGIQYFPQHFQVPNFKGHNCYGAILNIAAGTRIFATNLYGVWDDPADYPSQYALIRFGNGARHCGVTGFYGEGLCRGVRFADTHYCFASDGELVGMTGAAIILTQKDQKSRSSAVSNVLIVDSNRFIGRGTALVGEDAGGDDGDSDNVNTSSAVIVAGGPDYVLSNIRVECDTRVGGNGTLACTAGSTSVTVVNGTPAGGSSGPCMDRYRPGLVDGAVSQHAFLFDKDGNLIQQLLSLGALQEDTPSTGINTQVGTFTGGALVSQLPGDWSVRYPDRYFFASRNGVVTCDNTGPAPDRITAGSFATFSDIEDAIPYGLLVFRSSDYMLVGQVDTITTTYTPKTGTIAVSTTRTLKSGKFSIDTSVDPRLVTGDGGTSFFTELAVGDALAGSKRGNYAGIIHTIDPGGHSLTLVDPAPADYVDANVYTGPDPTLVAGTGTDFQHELVVGQTIYDTTAPSNAEVGTIASIDPSLQVLHLSTTAANEVPAGHAFATGAGEIKLTTNARQNITAAGYKIAILQKTAYGASSQGDTTNLHVSGFSASGVSIAETNWLAGTLAPTKFPSLALDDGSVSAPALAIGETAGLYADSDDLVYEVSGVEYSRFTSHGLKTQIVSGNVTPLWSGNATVTATISRYSTDASPTTVVQAKARGTLAAPAHVATNDNLGRNDFSGHDGTNFQVGARQSIIVTETTPGSTAMGCRLVWSLCATGSVSLTEIWRLEHATGLSLFGANPVIDQNRLFVHRSYTVAALPTGVNPYSRAFVTDATLTLAAGIGAAPTGGGTNKVPVHTVNGTNWVIG